MATDDIIMDGGIGIKGRSLRLALSEAGLRELPSPDDGKGFWTRAVVLVSKRNASESYALAERRATGVIRFVRDFGMASAIRGIVRIYPYKYLDESRVIGDVTSETAKRRISEHFGMALPDVEGLGKDALESMARQMAIDTQDEQSMLESLIADQIEQAAEQQELMSRVEASDRNVMVTDLGVEEIEDVVLPADGTAARGKTVRNKAPRNKATRRKS